MFLDLRLSADDTKGARRENGDCRGICECDHQYNYSQPHILVCSSLFYDVGDSTATVGPIDMVVWI